MKSDIMRIESANKEGVKFTKGIDLIKKVESEPEPKFLWHGIPEGSKGLIAGVAKTGKTTLAENLAMSLAVGRKEYLEYPLIGIPQKVLFLNLEESYKLHGRRNLKQISQFTSEEKELFDDNYMCAPEGFPEFLNTPEDWGKLRETVVASGAEVVFIDSLTHMFHGKIENSDSAKRFVERFRETFHGLDLTVVVVHHNTKGNDEPITQDSIAGSRVILQEFEFAYGLANIPTSRGGNYLTMLLNKHIPKDDTTAILYKLNEYGWVEPLDKANKYDLYNDNKYNKKNDGRTSSTNRNLIYNYIESQSSQGSQTTSTSTLIGEFVETDTRVMSKDTLHKSLNKLVTDGMISKQGQGLYGLNDGENE